MQGFRNRFQGSEEAITNILTLMVDKATAAEKHEISFCREESLGPCLGKKERKLLQDLLGMESFKFVENLKKQASEEQE